MKLIKKIVFVLLLSLTPFYINANQTITGNIDSNLDLFFSHNFQVNADKYNSFLTNLDGVGITKIMPEFLGSKTHSFNRSDNTINLPLKQFSGLENMELSYKTKPAFNTPVFVGYDLTLLTGSYLGNNNKISLVIPPSLEFIGSKPNSNNNESVEISYPKNDNFGEINVNFILRVLPEGYKKETVGMFHIIGKEEDVNKLKLAVRDLEFLPKMFKDITGSLIVDKIYLIIDDLSGRGDIYESSGGLLREPNIIILNREMLNIEYIPSLQKLIIHEAAHAMTLPLMFSGEQKQTGWLDEGIAVFFQNYAANKYLNEADYFIDNDSDGNYAFYQDLNFRFTASTLIKRYEDEFMYEPPKDENLLEEFYAHSGLVFYNFYNKVGSEGMKSFFEKIGSLHSSGICNKCDTKKVLNIMSEISSMKEEDLLYPYKNNIDNIEELVPIIKKEYTQEEIDTILSEKGSSVFVDIVVWIIFGLPLIIIALVMYFVWRYFKNKKISGDNLIHPSPPPTNSLNNR